MSDKARYPQIPGTVWWGVRGLLQRTPSAAIDDRTLGIQLNVQPVAAKQYISELQSVGILNEESRPTDLALKWRLDGTYKAAVAELLASIYPDNLLSLAPPESGDRQKAVSWFMHDGLGEGAAKNKAATYFLIGTPDPNESPAKASAKKSSDQQQAKSVSRKEVNVKTRGKATTDERPADPRSQQPPSRDAIPLNVNVQIHISAEAGADQIETIFAAMRRYLYDKVAS